MVFKVHLAANLNQKYIIINNVFMMTEIFISAIFHNKLGLDAELDNERNSAVCIADRIIQTIINLCSFKNFLNST